MSIELNRLVWMGAMLRLGFSTWTFSKLPLEIALRRIKDTGFDEVEIWADGFHLDPRMLSAEKLTRVRGVLSEIQLGVSSVHAPFTAVNLASAAPEERHASVALLIKSVRYCAQLECDLLVIHPSSGVSAKADFEMVWANTLESIEEIAVEAERQDVKIVLENMIERERSRLGGRVSDLNAIIKSLRLTNLGICVDTGHCNLSPDQERTPEKEIENAGRRLWSLHINDNNGVKDLHLPPGRGTIDWKKVMKALKSVGYSGVFMQEIYGGDDPDPVAQESHKKGVALIRGQAPDE